MGSIMQFWKKLLKFIFNKRLATSGASIAVSLLLLLGCDAIRDQKPGQLTVKEAYLQTLTDGLQLVVNLDCRLSGPMQDAFARGIPLVLVLELRSKGEKAFAPLARRIELRYFPLSQRYQLYDLDFGSVHNFSGAAYLMDALGSLRLPLPVSFAAPAKDSVLALEVYLDRAALPGALRLPALLEPAWRLATPEYLWVIDAG